MSTKRLAVGVANKLTFGIKFNINISLNTGLDIKGLMRYIRLVQKQEECNND